MSDLDEAIKKAPSFEEALTLTAEILKKKFARFSGVTIYVADGEDLVVHVSFERPGGPERVWSGGGPLAAAAQGNHPSIVSDVAGETAWAGVGLSKGSVMVAPVRTEAGLWAIVEIYSELRDAFSSQDVRFMEGVVAALARKTPAVAPTE
ncbi:MAG: GAF domain-containing protein [Vicinamibacteria bacterium]|nr:GAF domain-containing protein [Vicinamibacteria bacterium]